MRENAPPAATALQLRCCGWAWAGGAGRAPRPATAGLAALLLSPARLLLLPLPQAGRRLATGVPLPLATEWDGEDARLLACGALKRWARGEDAARLALLLLRLLDRSAAANVLGRPSSEGARPLGAMGSGGG